MAASQNGTVLGLAISEVLFILIIFTLIYNTLEDEFVFGESSSFIKCNSTNFTSQRNFLGLTDEDFSFLKLQDRIVDS
jgi:hypothetical protein